MWKSKQETDALVQKFSALEKLDRLYALSSFWKNAVFSDGYIADPQWLDILVWLPEGSGLLAKLDDLKKNLAEADFILALFGKFFHHDLIFDWRASDLDAIARLLETELRTQKIRLRIGLDGFSMTDLMMRISQRKLIILCRVMLPSCSRELRRVFIN